MSVFDERKFARMAKSPWLRNRLFFCPHAKNPRLATSSCTYSFPPFCVLRRQFLGVIERCDCHTQEQWTQWTGLRTMTDSELFSELKDAVSLGDSVWAGQVRSVMGEKGTEIPEELRRELEKLDEIRRGHRRDAAEKAKQTKKEKGEKKEFHSDEGFD